MTANKTAELFEISHHPHFENKFILIEKAIGGILKTGTREEIIVFCSEKLASSADIAELEEMIDNSDMDEEQEFEAEMYLKMRQIISLNSANISATRCRTHNSKNI